MKQASTQAGRRCVGARMSSPDIRAANGRYVDPECRSTSVPKILDIRTRISRVAAPLLLTTFLAAAAPEPVVTTPAEPILVEAVAFDQGGRMLVSAIHRPGIFRIDRGRLVRWSENARAVRDAAIFGIVADPARNALWAATSVTAYGGSATIGPALLRYDLRRGRLRQIVGGGDGALTFGDIALGPDGTVFVSDSGAGAVLKLAPGAAALERVIELETPRASPQGLVVSDDGAVLVFSNYGDGLHRVDLRTGAHARVLDADGKGPRGVDGVARRGDDLILVHNATQPARVLRVTLNADWTGIVAAEQLAEGAPMAEPTGGVVRDGEFIFVSRSQWTDFDSRGRPRSGLAPAVVSRLRLSSDE